MVAAEITPTAIATGTAPFVEWVHRLLAGAGVAERFLEPLATLVSSVLAIGLTYLTFCFLRRVVSPIITRIVTYTEVTWDDVLFNQMMLRAWSELVTAVVACFTISPALSLYPVGEYIALLVTRIAIVMAAVHLVNRFLMAVYDLLTSATSVRTGSLKGIRQMLQIISVCIGAIIIISLLINRSPLIILSGLGASAAVLMLVFKDSILGLVAGVQLTLNDMLRPGDWITAPKFGANGIVTEVTITTVKVRNFDMTTVTIPPYSLVSDSFQNWRGMKDSGGRRIKRSLFIDINSVRFLSDGEMTALRSALGESFGTILGEGDRKEANITLFRRYLEQYISGLPARDKGNPAFTCMVRELEPVAQGLPVEIYFFTDRQEWVSYEHLQADIIDHVLARVHDFGLRVFQEPSGFDILALRNSGSRPSA